MTIRLPGITKHLIDQHNPPSKEIDIAYLKDKQKHKFLLIRYLKCISMSTNLIIPP